MSEGPISLTPPGEKRNPVPGGHDLIIGRRHSAPDYTAYRRLASRVYTKWVSLAFGLRLRMRQQMEPQKREVSRTMSRHPIPIARGARSPIRAYPQITDPA